MLSDVKATLFWQQTVTPDNDLKWEIAFLIKEYGLDAVRAEVDAYRNPYGHFPDAPSRAKKGAPPIGPGRDAFTFALMELIRLGSGRSVSWCAQQVVKDCDITFYNPQNRGKWRSTLQNDRTVERIYYRARQKWAAEAKFREAVCQEMAWFLWWQVNAVDLTWGFSGLASPATGLHRQFKVRSAQSPCMTAIAKVRESLDIKIERLDLRKLRN